MERTGRAGRSRSQPVGRWSVGEAKLAGEGGGDVFRLVPERVSVRGAPAGYPAEWPAVSWIVRAQADFRCAHCGRRYPPGGLGEDALGVHHLDGDRFNLWDWNLVPLCLVDHGLVEREIHVDRDQLAMFGSGFPWLGPRVAARVAAIEAGLWSPGNRRRGLAVGITDEPEVLISERARSDAVVRYCACGCGLPLGSDRRARYARDACRVRALRARRGPQRDLMELVAAGTGGGSNPPAREGW